MAETKISDSDPHESFHFVANREKHSPDLLIDSLAEDHSQACRSDCVQARDLCALSVQKNSAHELLPEMPIYRLRMDHPAFHSFYEIEKVGFRDRMLRDGVAPLLPIGTGRSLPPEPAGRAARPST